MISVIIPVHDSQDHLAQCLRFLAGSTFSPDEIIVVDDSSSDRSGEIAREAGAKVIRLDGGPHGPAVARNQGARIATGEILLFLDADVAVHRGTIERMAVTLGNHPEVAAVFGSYDHKPAAGTFVSRYRNLLHHFVHQHGRREANTFWAGCGAIRRTVFLSVNGFDERFRRPSIEDIELGGRLRAAGHRVWLCSDVLVRHMKMWTLASVVWSDVFDRAVPWTRLILQHGRLPSDLNTAMRSRVSAIAAWILVLAPALALWTPLWLLATALAVATLGVLNARLYRFFVGAGGIRFVLTAIVMHVLYLLYSSAVFAVLAGAAWFARQRQRVLASPPARSAG
ncbi:MAG TPA: glycosyltransferase family 2 protein [Vicinamibacterales bacterium]|nr:glycosyltransferase family 2 protein [Vicinamibacterales bacterium]